MKVLHVIPSIEVGDGGPARAVVHMVRSLHELGICADIATTEAGSQDGPPAPPSGEPRDHEGCRTFFFPRQTGFYKISLPLYRWLRDHARSYDVVHAHSVFSFAPWAAGQAARHARVPYIVRPLGVLNRYGMEQRRPWLKALSFRWVDRPLLDGAAAIHYTSQQEVNEAARLHLRAPPAVIPPGLDMSPYTSLPPAADFRHSWPVTQGRRLLLYLSRIDEKKGLDILLPAFARLKLRHPDLMLVIAGDGDRELTARLQQQAAGLGISADILWTGFLDGRAKLAALAAADVYVLPSHSENFGIAVLEAMAAGCACVTTPGVALAHDAAESLCVVGLQAGPLADGIAALLENPDRAARLKSAARTCAFERFSAAATARQLANLYQKLAATAAAA